MKFKPAEKDGEPTDSTLSYTYRFELFEGEAASSQSAVLAKPVVLAVVKKNIAKVWDCGTAHGERGVVRVSWKIQPSGEVTEVAIADGSQRTNATDCMLNEISRWRFPPSSFITPVTFPLKLAP